GFLLLFRPDVVAQLASRKGKRDMNRLSSLKLGTNQKLNVPFAQSRASAAAMVLLAVGLVTQRPVYAVDPTDTFYGTGAGANTTTGIYDSGFGYNALFSNMDVNRNTASGSNAL